MSDDLFDKLPRDEKKAEAAKARAQALTPERRAEIARKAATSRWAGDLPSATHESVIKLGDLEIECAVLENEQRVISERAMTRAFGGKRGGSHWKRVKEGGANLPVYLSAKNYLPFIDSELAVALNSPVRYKTMTGNVAHGLDATLLPQVCNVFLKARDEGALHPKQIPLAVQADIIMRGLAVVGIIALIDEATGYQRERAVDALGQILEAFIAKELQPWVKTFPDDFYAELFRLRGLEFPRDTVRRPQYFGYLTNDIVYDRLAPGVKDELKRSTPKKPNGRRAHALHRRLTPDLGHPKLREHMASVVTIMKLSDGYEDFHDKLDRLHPKFGETMPLPLRKPGDTEGGL